ncbi:MAG TPA: ATP-binding protein [Nitrospira sp.]|nr:ATP-binding protein [Nitrospira sp.]
MRRLLKLFSDLPIARKLLLASVIPVLTVVLLSIATHRSVENFSEDESELNTLYLSQRLSAEYLRLVVDLETGFRGFVITKHEKYLYPYRTAQDHIQAVGLSLDEQVRRYDEQRALLSNVRRLVDQFIKEKDALIEAMKAGREDEAKRYFEEGRGRTIMVQIRAEMAHFDRARQQTLNTLLSRLSQDRSTMLSVILGGGTLALCLMLLALHLIARSITGPLVSLAKVVSSSPAGIAPTVPVMDRKDEIGNLTKVIHTMSSQLRAHLAMVEKSEAELRSVNRDLSASEAKYRNLVDLAPFGIFSTRGFDITFSNRYNRILAGLDPDADDDPEAFRQWIHPEDRERVLTEFARAVQERKPYETVFRFLHKDGTMRKVLSRRIPLDQEPGQSVVYQGFNIDITALDNMQQQLSRTERLATLGQVAAGIAHEIRNPLVGIGSTAALLRDEFDDADEKRADLDIILSETRRLDRIVNQIIDYARPRDLVPTTWPIDGLIDEVLKLFDTRLEAQRISVTRSNPLKLAALADRDQIKQILLNLCHNSLDAMPSGGQLQITAGQAARAGYTGIFIEVADTGSGISQKHLAQVFQPFFTSGKQHGTGLGLAICRNIAEAHGGDITLTSKPGHGTTARLWLPSRPMSDYAEMPA